MEIIYSLLPGTILKGQFYTYRIERTLGQGSFGITYLASVKMAGALGAIDAKINVAIKEFFMRDINGRTDTNVTSGSNGGIYEDYKKKFKREALNLSILQHPNIVKVIESFEANNTVYYVMEYIGGGSLDDYILKGNGLKVDEAIKIAVQIGSALSYMHAQGMLHLDLKPSNIMMKESGDIVLIDFGLSKQYNSKGEPESSTKVGAGTPGYAPIEQANYREGKGFPVTMDVYSLGATLFKMLTGVRPPEASDILNDGFPFCELQNKNVSDSLSACIAKAMAPIKKDRCQSVNEFINSLNDSEETIVDIEIVDKAEKCHKTKDSHTISHDSGFNMSSIISNSKANPNVELEIAGLSDIGYVKLQNEDSYGWCETINGNVFIISDGSKTDNLEGCIASTIVVQSIHDYLNKEVYDSPIEAISGAINYARDQLIAKNKEIGSDLRSTCVLAIIRDNKLYWGCIGNCRIYSYSAKSGLVQLSKDQSFVQTLVDKGALKKDEAKLHPEKDFGINHIGIGMLPPEISKCPFIPSEGGLLLLCSDGLTNMVEDHVMEEILMTEESSLNDKILHLKEMALANGGKDNITITAIRFVKVDTSVSYRWWLSLFILATEIGFAYFMLTLSQEGDLDSDGQLLAGLYFFASLVCVYYLYMNRKNIPLSKWRMATIIFTTACFVNSCMLPIWNGSLNSAYFLLSLGLSTVSSFTFLIKKSL